MSTGGIIASGVMLIVGLIWLALPLLRRKFSVRVEELAHQKERAILLTTYERTLATIRDLDEDHLTGKLTPSDYETERAYWTEQGVAILQALEKDGIKKLTKQAKSTHFRAPVTATEVDADTRLDESIEQAIASYIESSR